MKMYYDLHIHSAASPCGDGDMTPNNIVNMAVLNGLDIIAVSDHNTCANVRAVAQVADRSGVIFVPAMELETAEEIHVLCLFSSVDEAERFDREVVTPALPEIENNERIFGIQQIIDSDDNVVRTDPRYLLNATSISIDNVHALVKDYHGIAIPSHIDKQTKSLISVFGMADESLGFSTFELSKNAPQDFETGQFSLKNKNYNYLHDSDAHYLTDIFESGGKNSMEFENRPKTAADIIAKIKNGF